MGPLRRRAPAEPEPEELPAHDPPHALPTALRCGGDCLDRLRAGRARAVDSERRRAELDAGMWSRDAGRWVRAASHWWEAGLGSEPSAWPGDDDAPPPEHPPADPRTGAPVD